MDQTKGEKKCGPYTNDEEKDLICWLNNASILAETKIEIMQHAFAKCPKVCISTMEFKFHVCWIPAAK